jgi:hypothetical protein
VLPAICPAHTLAQGLCLTIHLHQTDFPAERLHDFRTPGNIRFLITSIHHGKEHAIEVRVRGGSEHRIPEVPQQATIGGSASGKYGSSHVHCEVVMEDRESGQPGNLLRDG